MNSGPVMTHVGQARAILLRLQRAFDGRARRERLLLLGAGVALAWMAADGLWLSPAFRQWSAARSQQASATTALQRLNAEIVREGGDARAAAQGVRSDLAQWRERVARGDAELRDFGATLVGAPEMVPMLDQLLAQVGGLQLRSMQSLGRSEVGAPPAGAANAAGPGAKAEPHTPGVLYRHGVELVIEGSYPELLAYLQAIESMPKRVLWGGLQLKVEQYPKVTLTLQIYTLSQDRTWLEI